MELMNSRFVQPYEIEMIDRVQKALTDAGLVRVTDQKLIDKIQQVRNSVSSIREWDRVTESNK